MDYTGEHLLPGRMGHFFILLSLTASVIATLAYFKTVRAKLPDQQAAWKKLARISFGIEVLSVLMVTACLYYIMGNRFYEYKYAYEHTSNTLETKYLFSAFWTNQEGSFLLWSFWHCVLGVIVMFRSKEWEAPVMTVISAVQVCLATMVLGLYVFGYKIGSNPFTLLRETPFFNSAPAFFDPETGKLVKDYLTKVTDGNDLNILLQNYWMVIHPPVLFLGFASTLIPFAYAVAGLWTRQYGESVKKSLSWSLFSAGILGLGIMMGGKWAYESLNFGGYWAWDPVENASLVPWLVLVAGIHTLLIFKHTGRALRTTHLFFLLTFILVVYSTFLTRSGVLSDTSVHAFTSEGMKVQLLAFLLLVTLPPLILFASQYRSVPAVATEEQASSREFWMFIGSLVFFLAGLFITLGTSLPVINLLFNTRLNTGEDAVFFYNRVLIFVAIIIGLLTAIVQYLKYKSTPASYFWKKMLWPLLISVAATALILQFGNINFTDKGGGFLIAIWVTVAASVYAIVANFAYIFTGVKGKLGKIGGSVTHFGFGVFLLGVLLSSAKKEILSWNTSGIPIAFGPDSKEKSGENLTLVKGLKTDMGKYWVSYSSDSVFAAKKKWFYNLDFETKDGKEKFKLQPTAYVNRGMQGLSAEPDARHYLTEDVFVYITSTVDPDKNADTSKFYPKTMKPGDTSWYRDGFYILDSVTSKNNIPGDYDPADVATLATVKVFSKTNAKYRAQLLYINSRKGVYATADTVMAEGLVFQINALGKDGRSVELGVKESSSIMQYLTLKAYRFPMIILVWAGTVIMILGFFISMLRRMSQRNS